MLINMTDIFSSMLNYDMNNLTKKLALPLCLALCICTARGQQAKPQAQQGLRIVGASTVVLPVKDATVIMKKEMGITLQVSPVVNTSGQKIAALGENLADIAMFARPLTAADRAPYPDITFKEIQFGDEAAVLVVSQDLWNAGVHSITREAAREIYEQKVTNWKDIGGPNVTVVGYTPETTRGIWDCYVQWLYDDPTTMRENHFALVNSDDEAKEDLEATPGSFTQVSLTYAQANHLHILAIKNSDGKLIQPSLATITDRTYPMSRPLIMVLKGRPFGDILTFVRFILSDRGQDLVHKYNYLTLKELGITPPVF